MYRFVGCVCEEVNMSVRSKFDSDGNDVFDRAVSRLRSGATSRLMAERARQQENAANSPESVSPSAEPSAVEDRKEGANRPRAGSSFV